MAIDDDLCTEEPSVEMDDFIKKNEFEVKKIAIKENAEIEADEAKIVLNSEDAQKYTEAL